MELVLFVGLQGSGKSGYFASRYSGTHVHVSKDLFPPHARKKSDRQLRQIEQALATGRSVVVDNTNPRRADRAAVVETGRRSTSGWSVRRISLPRRLPRSTEADPEARRARPARGRTDCGRERRRACG